MVDIVEYHRPSIDSDGSIQFIQMMFSNDDNMRIMFSIFSQHTTKWSIKLDASLLRFFDGTQESLIWSMPMKKSEIAWRNQM
ncbi:hypothetical protein MTR_4g052240 [Medicago truncatula]|uniref:Uncharacterized protein n=1 Tax=Medicago truncatula TaxID=3880 RepID=A0A072UVC0_MEDTR|nr:hypothetical protein MTR_4g052240 [Medicago truncatula]